MQDSCTAYVAYHNVKIVYRESLEYSKGGDFDIILH